MLIQYDIEIRFDGRLLIRERTNCFLHYGGLGALENPSHTVRINCFLVVETWECINQLFGHAKQHTHNAAK